MLNLKILNLTHRGIKLLYVNTLDFENDKSNDENKKLMITFTHYLEFDTKGEIDIINLTNDLEDLVNASGVKNGMLIANCIGSTGAITTIEFEPRVLEDFRKILQKLVPKGAGYRHDEIDSNAHSHLRASLIGPSVAIAISKGKLQLGIWQQVVFVDLDVRPRSRRVAVSIIGKE